METTLLNRQSYRNFVSHIPKIAKNNEKNVVFTKMMFYYTYRD